MQTVDLIKMLNNFLSSSFEIQRVTAGFAYVLGIVFIYHAFQKLKAVGDAKPGSPSQVKMIVPVAYILSGAALLFLPSMAQVASNTFFGVSDDNAISYTNASVLSIEVVMYYIIKMAGVIWFVRGCVLLAHASEPSFKHGAKGLVFLIAGILAMNFESTRAFLQVIFNWLQSIFSTII